MRSFLTAAVLLALAPAAYADPGDTLLSGYGGPGDGEQALLGQTLISDSGDGQTPGAASGPATPAPSPDELFEEPAPAEAPAGTSPAGGKHPATGNGNGSAKPTPTRAPVQQRPDRSTPQSSIGTGGSASAPAAFSGRDLGLALAVLAALIVLASIARRLAVRAARSRRPVPLT